MKKAPNRVPNRTCVMCSKPYYRAWSNVSQACSMTCRTENYRRMGTLLTGAAEGPANPRWKGGRWTQGQGYVLVLVPDHPSRDRHGYVREHRLVMEQKLGRYLVPGEVVHHLNHVRDDNRPENLELYASNGEHKRNEHFQGRPPQGPA
jgi:HNH endonuclease